MSDEQRWLYTGPAGLEEDNTMTRDELIVALCREAGDTGTEDALVAGYEGNHCGCCGKEIDLAAAGDVAALCHVRTCIGLPILR